MKMLRRCALLLLMAPIGCSAGLPLMPAPPVAAPQAVAPVDPAPARLRGPITAAQVHEGNARDSARILQEELNREKAEERGATPGGQ